MKKSKHLALMLIISMIISLTACMPKEHVLNNNSPDSADNTITEVVSSDATLTQSGENIAQDSNSKFEVHFIDVGQADAALIFSDSETMLIDGGNVDDSSLIVSYLKKHNITHLNYIVCTHAHEDHVGGLSGALSIATADKIFAPKTESDIKAYKNFKAKVAARGCTIENPKPGEFLKFGSSTVLFLGPVHENVSDINDTSIILKITYGETSFLFTGDAEREEEQSILSQNYNLSSTLLKVGHHGSADSTTYPFLREIMPELAIISVGENNYGHPTEETLSRLHDAGVKVYRTDLHGDIIVSSNGKSVNIETERNQNIDTNDAPSIKDNQKYIGNIKSKKFHLSSCHSLPYEKNRIYFKTKEEAIDLGYSSCRICTP